MEHKNDMSFKSLFLSYYMLPVQANTLPLEQRIGFAHGTEVAHQEDHKIAWRKKVQIGSMNHPLSESTPWFKRHFFSKKYILGSN